MSVVLAQKNLHAGGFSVVLASLGSGSVPLRYMLRITATLVNDHHPEAAQSRPGAAGRSPLGVLPLLRLASLETCGTCVLCLHLQNRVLC